MPIYEVQKNGKTYEVEAPTAQAAAQALAHMPGDTSKLDRLLAEVVPGMEGVARGAVKGMGNTAFGLGKAVRDYTPIGRLSDAILPGAFDQRPQEITPQGKAEHLGFAGEQIAEFFLPTGAEAKLAKVAEMVKSGFLTKAQGGTGTDAGLSATLSGLVPGAKAFTKAKNALRSNAEKTVVQALGPTKEWAKAEATAIAPEMLQRGVKGSRATMLSRSTDEVASIGKQIGAEVNAAAQAGKTIDGASVTSAIQRAKQALTVAGQSGADIPIEGAQVAVRRLDRLEKFVAQLGPDIPFDKAQKVKIAWDRVVSKAGLYGPKATSSATDNANAWAIREASSTFRDLLAKGSPSLEALNKEYGFWKGLKNVLTETEKRTQAQGGGLVAGITGAAGAASGFASGGDLSDKVQNAIIGGAAGRQLVRAMQSPWWRTSVSAPLKNALADALAKGNGETISRVIGQITAAVPVQARHAQRALAQ